MNDSAHLAFRITDSLLRHRWLLLVTVLGVSGTAALAIGTRPATYSATAYTRIIADDTATVVGVTPGATGLITASPAQQNITRFEDLSSDDRRSGFLDQALQRAQLDRPIRVDRRGYDPRYRLLRKGLSVNSSSDTMFAISLIWDNPGEAQRIVKALQDQYLEAVSAGQQAKAMATEKFLGEQLADYEQRLAKADQALIEFKQRNFSNSPEVQAALSQQLSNLKAELDKLRITSQDSHLKRQALQQRLAQIRPTIEERTIETSAGGPARVPSGESAAERQLRELQERRTALLTLYQPTSSEVRYVDSQIEELRHQIEAERRSSPAPESATAAPDRVVQMRERENPEYRQVMQQLTETDIAEKTQQAQMARLQQQIAEHETRLAQMPAAQRELATKTRDSTVLKAQYERLLERREQAQIKSDLDRISANSTLMPTGTIVAEPTTTRTKQLIMLVGSLFAGLFLGIGLIFLREWLDPSVRYGWDVERLLGVPLLSALPDSSEGRPLALPPANDPPDDASPLSQPNPQGWIAGLTGSSAPGSTVPVFGCSAVPDPES
jgi:uncharacterized protein involved in exopolysaccharide biosynthesis